MRSPPSPPSSPPPAGKAATSWSRRIGELLLTAALPALASAALAGEFRRPAVVAAPPPAIVADDGGSSGNNGYLTASQARELAASRGGQPPLLWVDARPENLYARGHAPGAVPLTEERWGDQLAEVLARWEPATPVVVYCDGGDCHASERVAARLRDEGLSPVFVLRGGWPALEKAEGGRRKAE